MSERDTRATGRSDDGLLEQRRGGRAVREGEEPIRLGARRPRGLDVERAAGHRYDDRDAQRRRAGRRRKGDSRRAVTNARAVAARRVLVTGSVMGRGVVHRPASAGRNHRPHAVHVAPETLGVAEAHLAQKSQEDEQTAEAEQQGRGTMHGLGCYADLGPDESQVLPEYSDGTPRQFIPPTVGTACPFQPRSWSHAIQSVEAASICPKALTRGLQRLRDRTGSVPRMPAHVGAGRHGLWRQPDIHREAGGGRRAIDR